MKRIKRFLEKSDEDDRIVIDENYILSIIANSINVSVNGYTFNNVSSQKCLSLSTVVSVNDIPIKSYTSIVTLP